MSSSNRFESLLHAAAAGGESTKPWRDALALVADTALICRAWLDVHTEGWTPADLLAMTNMVLDRTPFREDAD